MTILRHTTLAACTAFALLLPAGASAQFPFTPKPATSSLGPRDTFKFTSASGVSGFGTQVGPYTAQVTSYPGKPLITVYCVDFLHSISVGQVWTANVSNLTMADIGDTRLGIAGNDANALSRYRKGAWLASQFLHNQNAASWRELHSAIWTTIIAGNDPTKAYYNKYGSWIEQVNEAAADGYQGLDFENWQVITDVRADDMGAVAAVRQPGAQEYLVHVTPEPETVVMLLSGLMVLAVVFRRSVFG